MTEKLEKQIRAVAATGKTNMFDLANVQRIANDMRFCELVIYIEDEPLKYSNFILTGKEEE